VVFLWLILFLMMFVWLCFCVFSSIFLFVFIWFISCLAEMNQLLIDFKKAYDSVRIFKFRAPMKLFMLIKMCSRHLCVNICPVCFLFRMV
jgi:hypothetical protein